MSDQPVPARAPRAPGVSEAFDLFVVVSQRHIAKGKPGNCRTCPLALAILEACSNDNIQVGTIWNVEVYGDHASLTLADGAWRTALLPYTARTFIRHFDHGDLDQLDSFDCTLRFEVEGTNEPAPLEGCQ